MSDDRRTGMSATPKSQLGAGSRLGDGSARRSPSPLSQQGDYYQNTNPLQSSRLNPNTRASFSQRGMSLQPVSTYGTPQLPMPNFSSSQPGSEHGVVAPYAGSLHGPTMSMNMGLPGYAGSMYGMPPQMGPRTSIMTNLNMFPGGTDNGMAGVRPMSTFSMNPTSNPFPQGPNQNADPSDDELLNVLRTYLGTQDLMTVTKK